MTVRSNSLGPDRRANAAAHVVGVAATGLWWVAAVIVQILRLIVSAVLILAEPVVRAILVPVALLGFLVTLVFGFLIGDPNFPRWGMLAFSVGALVLYWLYLGLVSLFMSLPSHDRHHR